VDDEPAPVSSTFVHCLPEVHDDPAPRERLPQLARRVRSSCGMSVSSISIIVTSVPKRSKIDANSQPMIPPPSTTSASAPRLREEARRVDAARRLEPGIGGVIGCEPVAMIALVKLSPRSPLSNAIERAPSKRASLPAT
jgi:hypothetical protein